jgi:universal stress protein A
MRIRKIMVPTDFSSDATRALELATELARTFQAKIDLVHVCFLGPYLGGFPEPIGIPADFAEKVRAEAASRLEALGKQVIAPAGIVFESHVSEASPAPGILELARSLSPDLIVMGTRGLTGVKHVLLGSIAERTVRLAPCPVLTVKADD